jgi:hypothetical protein
MEAFHQIAGELLGIAVPVALKKDITEPIENAVTKLMGLQDAVERMSKQDAEELENLRKINQEMAEKLMGKAAPAGEQTEPKTE